MALGLLLASALPAQITTKGCRFLCNSDFEDVMVIGPNAFTFVDQSAFPCWNTTASDGKIEVWGHGFNGVPAFSGQQFIELNANMVSTLFQNFEAVPGSKASVRFAHRGRAGKDVMSVELGPAGGPYLPLGTFEAGNQAWEYHAIDFTFPLNQDSAFSLRFRSVSAAGGATVGNFLDAISIDLPIPELVSEVVAPTCPNAPDGSISAAVSGGTPPYQWAWSLAGSGDTSAINGLLPGTYTLTLTDAYGCAVMDTRILESTGIPVWTLSAAQACAGDTLWFQGQMVVEPGTYTDTLLTVQGCDSILLLEAGFWPVHRDTGELRSCTPYSWQGMVLTESGLYEQRLVNQYGCDSVLLLALWIDTPEEQVVTATACDSFYWAESGQTYVQAGRFSVVYPAYTGCDSLITLDLDLQQSTAGQYRDSACLSYFWAASGQTYVQSGIYTTRLQNAAGCDSMVVLDLTIHPDTEGMEFRQACATYRWPATGELLSASGTYLATLESYLGCDSLAILNLDVLPPRWDVDTIMASGAYFWPFTGQYYASEGAYTVSYQDSLGCPAWRVLLLTLIPDAVVYVPNAFSPDGDGINDRFTLYGNTFARRIQRLNIYDRWGNFLWQGEDFPLSDVRYGWDGSARGRLLDPGVFVYVAEVEMEDDSVRHFKGDVTLIR